MKTIISTWIAIVAVSTFSAVPALATLNGPSTDGDGNYTITWPTVCGNDSWYYLHENGQQVAAKYCTSGSFAISGRSNGTYNYVLNHCNTFWPEPGLICDFDLGSNSGTHTVVVTGSEPPPPPPAFDSRAFGPCRIALDNPPPDPEYNYIEAWWENNLVCQEYLAKHNAYPNYDINRIQNNGLPILIDTLLLDNTFNAYGLLVLTHQLEAMNAGGFNALFEGSGANLAAAAGLVLSSVSNPNDNWWFSFSGDAHDEIYDDALGDYNLPTGVLAALKFESRLFDQMTGWQPWGSERHHMCDTNETPTTCRDEVEAFIVSEMEVACAASQSGNSPSANQHAARAMHAVTDGSSPVHVDAQTGEIIVWRISDTGIHGSFSKSQEDVDDLTPDILAETKPNVRYVYDTVYNNSGCENIVWPPNSG